MMQAPHYERTLVVFFFFKFALQEPNENYIEMIVQIFKIQFEPKFTALVNFTPFDYLNMTH